MRALVALLAGLLFGLGLVISGMANPAKVLGFLDLFGQWDPSLALVMVGAIAAALLPMQWVQRSGRDLRGETVTLPGTRLIDRRLVVGSPHWWPWERACHRHFCSYWLCWEV